MRNAILVQYIHPKGTLLLPFRRPTPDFSKRMALWAAGWTCLGKGKGIMLYSTCRLPIQYPFILSRRYTANAATAARHSPMISPHTLPSPSQRCASQPLPLFQYVAVQESYVCHSMNIAAALPHDSILRRRNQTLRAASWGRHRRRGLHLLRKDDCRRASILGNRTCCPPYPWSENRRDDTKRQSRGTEVAPFCVRDCQDPGNTRMRASHACYTVPAYSACIRKLISRTRNF